MSGIITDDQAKGRVRSLGARRCPTTLCCIKALGWTNYSMQFSIQSHYIPCICCKYPCSFFPHLLPPTVHLSLYSIAHHLLSSTSWLIGYSRPSTQWIFFFTNVVKGSTHQSQYMSFLDWPYSANPSSLNQILLRSSVVFPYFSILKPVYSTPYAMSVHGG